ncbi:Hemerythrin HHE cation binding domain-containing protein [Cryptosporangium aurantiacum]|uniref:Hemerythrin HHE cation binding domain-containing protein n=2 Tax=Cryptosporangium aurantiacum TaxID=134849 RepID=A0A1M7RNV5_9ACTN|nr:Hemerythrin HHE cation binding domain-containing protein [Cryptosporangium aurantiacum]
MTRLRESITDGEPREKLSTELGLFCLGFCTALNSHHRAEDGELFPRILAEHPGLAPVVAKLNEDHVLLGYLLTDLERAVATADADELLRHLDGIEAIMDSHFGFEERQITAVLDAMTTTDADIVRLLGAD